MANQNVNTTASSSLAGTVMRSSSKTEKVTVQKPQYGAITEKSFEKVETGQVQVEEAAEEYTPIAPPPPKVVRPKTLDEMTDDEILRAAQIVDAREKIENYEKKKRDENIEAIVKKQLASDKRMMQSMEMVEVTLPQIEVADEYRKVTVNGYKVTIPVGVPTLIPRPHAEVLKMAQKQEAENYKMQSEMQRKFMNTTIKDIRML